MSELRFDGRVALVTGAGGGLGREHALLLASRGAAVMVNDLGSPTMGGQDHDPSPAEAVVEEIQAAGGVAAANSDSVATREGADSMVAETLEEFGQLDIVINNAGIIRNRTFLNINEYEFEPVIDVHVKGCFFVSRPAYEHMKSVGYGRIINTSSGSGLFGSFGQSAYSAAKAAIYGFTRTLAIEGSRYGIPQQVAPAGAYLAHESCSLNGETLSASGGRVGRAFMGVTKGIYEEDLTLESVAERIDEICDEDDYVVPANVDQEMQLLLEHFNTDDT